MQRDNEDEAWRAIVENYGERPQLGADPLPEEPLAASGPSWRDVYPDESAIDEERFVPPTPPPIPRPARDRLLAWLGVFGAPTVLLVCLVAGIRLPGLLSYALVAAFVGGFLYLVWRMPRGPRDPWDDGAQL